jgi:catechol 2,3-dioxygenase-like lactoylglutathione lyase family enzyme
MDVRNQVMTFEWLSPTRSHRTGATLWAALHPDDKDWGRANPTAMVNYRVDDLDWLLAQLEKEGVPVEERAEDPSAGRFGWVTDPDGNRVELWEPPQSRYRSPDRHVPMG